MCPACGEGPETQDRVWRCQEKQYAVIREKFLTKKNEELRKESRFTQTTLLLQRSEELITCGMRDTGKRMKFVQQTAAEKIQGGDGRRKRWN